MSGIIGHHFRDRRNNLIRLLATLIDRSPKPINAAAPRAEIDGNMRTLMCLRCNYPTPRCGTRSVRYVKFCGYEDRRENHLVHQTLIVEGELRKKLRLRSMAKPNLTDLTLAEQAQLLHAGDCSSRELVDAYLSRIGALDS